MAITGWGNFRPLSACGAGDIDAALAAVAWATEDEG